jgi:hypothetical protein
MGRVAFFDAQRVDEIGYASVGLQKVLIWLMLVNVLNYLTLSVGWWLIATIELLILFIGFRGAVQRNRRALNTYVCINITIFIVFVLFPILSAITFSARGDAGEDDILVAGENKTNTIPQYYPNNTELAPNSTVNVDILITESQVPWALILFMWVFSLIVFIVKVYSVILASKVSKMIKAKETFELEHPIMSNKQPMYAPIHTHIPLYPGQQHQPIYHVVQDPQYFNPNVNNNNPKLNV